MRCYNHSLPHNGDFSLCNPVAAAADVSYLLRSTLKYKRAIIVGHDWGASIAYAFAKFYPAQVEQLAILQIPHPNIFKHFLLTSTQVFHSWYMFLFQVPVFAERFLRKESCAFLQSWALGASHAQAFSKADVQQLTQTWLADNDTLSGMLGYYRWIKTQFFEPPEPAIPRSMPFLFLFGDGDEYVDKRMVEPTITQYAPHGKAILLPGTHWVQHDVSDSVNQHLLSFFTSEK